jgi:hypothetical protein
MVVLTCVSECHTSAASEGKHAVQQLSDNGVRMHGVHLYGVVGTGAHTSGAILGWEQMLTVPSQCGVMTDVNHIAEMSPVGRAYEVGDASTDAVEGVARGHTALRTGCTAGDPCSCKDILEARTHRVIQLPEGQWPKLRLPNER